MEYFDRFGLEPKWDLDLQDLERRFHSLSRVLHPDRYTRASAQEQRAALEASARLNDAWRTLKDPVLRAEYLLEHLDAGGPESPELLEEVFEWNLECEQLRYEPDPQKCAAARVRFAALCRQTDQDFARKFKAYDETRARELLPDLRMLLSRRKYLKNIINNIH
jgi:molecular chaperone HscB